MSFRELIALEPLGADRFGASAPGEGLRRRPFGGHLLAQALQAASLTVEDRPPHLFQTLFLRAGRPDLPIAYEVARLQDGARFASRRVAAVQAGRTLLEGLVSFQHLEAGLEHQGPMPAVPAPEGLPTEASLREEAFQTRDVQWVRSPVMLALPFELRPVQLRDFIDPPPQPGRLDFWARATEPVGEEYTPAFLACLSDALLLSSTLLPHGLSWATTDVEGSTLNHAMWFHRSTCVEGWLLYSIEVIWTGGTRGLARGSLWERSGALVASVVQEGLIRLR